MESCEAGLQQESSVNIEYSNLPVAGLQIMSCRGERNFGKHLHNGYVLWLNSEAHEYYSVQKTSHVLPPGSISIIEPGVIHSNYPGDERRRHLRSFYFGERFQEYLAKKTEVTIDSQLQIVTSVIKNKLLWEKFIFLHNSLQYPCTDQIELECLTVDSFASFFGLFKKASTVRSFQGRNEGARLAKVIEYFHENYQKDICLDKIARLAQCSSYHLIRLFREQKGISPYAYLVQVRLEYAKRMIEKGRSIAEAAFLAGFSDQSHLTRKFKIRYGIPPGKFLCQRGIRN